MISYQPYTFIELDVNYTGEVRTLRLGPPQTGVPVGEFIVPCLDNVSLRTGSVNIGGLDKRLSAFGERAELTFTVRDFPAVGMGRWFASYEQSTFSPNGDFFARLVQKWPAFSGAAVRVVEASLDGGVITSNVVKSYILRELSKGRNDTYTFTALDPLDLAANDNALAPAPSSGVLFADISASATSFTLSPTGIGDEEYPASGRATIGSEYFSFTRVGDVVTFTQRGIQGTSVASHQEGDTVQVALFYENALLDEVGADLLLNFAGLDPAFVPTATWAAERQRWASTRRITTDIPEPTPVDELMGELATLACSFWWDDVDQVVGFKAIRPPDGETVFSLTDDDIRAVSVDWRDEDRITEVVFSTVLKAANENPRNYDSYQRHLRVIESDALALHGRSRQLQINCRLLNQGADTLVRLISRRILALRSKAPKEYTITLDAKDTEIGLTDIIQLKTRSLQDEDGNPLDVTLQVIKRTETKGGHEFTVVAQEFEYGERLFYIAPNDMPDFLSAEPGQQERFGFLSDSNGLLADGSQGHTII